MKTTMNPNIRTLQVGRKNLTEITLYPLSVADVNFITARIRLRLEEDLSFLFTGQDSEALGALLKASSLGLGASLAAKTLVAAASLFEEEVGAILAMATDDPDEAIRRSQKANPILNDITASQVQEALVAIWEVNFAPLGKQMRTLVTVLAEKIQEAFALKTPQP